MQIDTLHQFVVEMWQRAERKWIFQSAAFFFDVAMGKKIGLERQDGNICFSRYEAGG